MDVNKNIKWKIHYYFSWAAPFIVETNIVSSRHLIYVASFPSPAAARLVLLRITKTNYDIKQRKNLTSVK